MRCFFMRAGRIAGVTFLKSGPDDALTQEARRAFEQHKGQQFDGFEVWDGTRFVYRSDITITPSDTERASGAKAADAGRNRHPQARLSLSLFLIDRLLASTGINRPSVCVMGSY